jgi:hypothetical protein
VILEIYKGNPSFCAGVYELAREEIKKEGLDRRLGWTEKERDASQGASVENRNVDGVGFERRAT